MYWSLCYGARSSTSVQDADKTTWTSSPTPFLLWHHQARALLTSRGIVSLPPPHPTLDHIINFDHHTTCPPKVDFANAPQDVPCPVSGPLQIHMKSGVSQYWFSAQVVNAHRRTAKLEVSINQGQSWKRAQRTTYNFFEISSGVGASSAWIRVTSATGSRVVVKDVPMTSDALVKAGSNFA